MICLRDDHRSWYINIDMAIVYTKYGRQFGNSSIIPTSIFKVPPEVGMTKIKRGKKGRLPWHLNVKDAQQGGPHTIGFLCYTMFNTARQSAVCVTDSHADRYLQQRTTDAVIKSAVIGNTMIGGSVTAPRDDFSSSIRLTIWSPKQRFFLLYYSQSTCHARSQLPIHYSQKEKRER